MKFNNKKKYDFSNKRIRCKTFEEAKKLLTIAHEQGFCWNSGKSLLETTNWTEYGKNTVYIIWNGRIKYSDINWPSNYKPIDFEDFIKKCYEI